MSLLLWWSHSAKAVRLQKVISSFIQGRVNLSKMGATFTRSYSPNSDQTQNTCGGGGRATISRMESECNYVEAIVCNENDMEENQMKEFPLGDEGKVLVVKQKGEFNAIGTKCTHYGAPLVNGALGKGRVRCPWHGACFNLKTGDIEDFPGFDSLPCYQVTVTEKGQVKVKAKISDLKSNKRVKDMGSCPCDNAVVVIVGGGPSGATCAETLRSEGFKGRIVLVAKENYLPYDRIKVSKIGAVTDIEKLQARTAEYYKNANIEIMKGVEAVKIYPEAQEVHLSTDAKLRYSSLYLATGSKPRVPDFPGIHLNNIFTVRNYDDSINILNFIGTEKTKDVAILGLGFIGLEVASTCVANAKSCVVIGTDTAPLANIFGTDIGRRLQKLFEDKGVKFYFETSIKQVIGLDGNVKTIELVSGIKFPADLLVLGIGTTYYTDFLQESGITLEPNGSVKVDDYLETNIKNIYAGGDIAYAPVHAAPGDARMSIGHVGLAQYHGKIAALNILKKKTKLRTVPYFWTTLFGKSIRYAGCGKAASSRIEGDLDEMKFVIFFFDEKDMIIGVASCMRDPIVSQFAELLHQGRRLYKKDLKDDPFAWTKYL